MRGRIVKITAYTLSTCVFCHRFKQFMKKHKVPFKYVDVDLLNGEEKEAVKKEAQSHCPGCGYPIIVAGDEVIRGFDEERLREVLGV